MQYIAIILVLLTSFALAQDKVEGANPELMQHAINALAGQRNRALDEAATAEAQLAQALKTITDLKSKYEPKVDPKVDPNAK